MLERKNRPLVPAVALLLILFACYFSLRVAADEAETFTLTTYYPSPIGLYKELRAKRMAVGDIPVNQASDFCWEPDSCEYQVAEGADLLVEGNVGIGRSVKPKAILDITSTTSGFLPPRMTAAERDAIVNPPEGSIVYVNDETIKEYNYYDGTSWQALGGGGPGTWDCKPGTGISGFTLNYHVSRCDTGYRVITGGCVANHSNPTYIFSWPFFGGLPGGGWQSGWQCLTEDPDEGHYLGSYAWCCK